MPRNRRIPLLIAVAALVLAAGWFAWDSAQRFPRRLHVVEPNVLYRSGELSPAQLENVVRAHGVRTVLSLLNPDVPESRAERAAAERLGLRWINIPLRGDGSSNAEQRDQIRAVVLENSDPPLLVHCAAGVNRTGLACGMYRLHRQGWTLDQVLDEMRRIGFEDLPKHENLRQALADEARLAAERRAASPPADIPGG